jgi:hypothetical protein
MYGVPRGGEYNNGKWQPNIVTGFTIRFVEMITPYVRNVAVEMWPIGEDDNQYFYRIVRMDYESNTPEGRIITVPKTVERKKTKDGDVVLGSRQNSQGQTVFIVRATPEEVDNKKAALYSKTKRDLILSILPGWLKEAAEQEIRNTQRTVDAEDPDAARKRLYAGFAKVGVTVEQVREYIGHNNDLQPAELEELRIMYSAIAEGQTTWKEIMQAKEDGGDADYAEEIQKLLDASGRNPAQQRKLRIGYPGQDAKLLAFLREEAAKGQAQPTEPQHPHANDHKPAPAQTPPAASTATTGHAVADSVSHKVQPINQPTHQQAPAAAPKAEPKPAPKPQPNTPPPPAVEENENEW